jgi:hypothetical protein
VDKKAAAEAGKAAIDLQKSENAATNAVLQDSAKEIGGR